MPYYAGLTPAGSTGGGVAGPWLEDAGTMSATWTDPDGTVWPLTDPSDDRGFFTTQDISGWAAGPYEIVTDPVPRGGETVRFIRANPSRITWPIYVFGDTHQQFIDRYRALRRAFLSTLHRQTPGLLTVYRPDGSARSIEAYYADGWTGQAGQGWLYETVAVTLFCPTGVWQDVHPLTIHRGAGTPVPFGTPFLTLTSSQVLGETIVTNPGDVTAWPDWTITGPSLGLVATNNTTGQTFTLNYGLNPGERATITSDPPMVRGPAGQNISGSLNWPTAYLWGLQPGDNDITFDVLGADLNSAIDLLFYPRYEGC